MAVEAAPSESPAVGRVGVAGISGIDPGCGRLAASGVGNCHPSLR